MLKELLRVMRPGGRAYISVWATLQEDPAKTLAKWEPMQPLPPSSHTPHSVPIPNGNVPQRAHCEPSPDIETLWNGHASSRGSASASEPEACCNGHTAQHADGASISAVPEPSSSHLSESCPAADSTSAQCAAKDASAADATRDGLQQEAETSGHGNDYFVPWHLPLHRAQSSGLLNHIPHSPPWARPQDAEGQLSSTMSSDLKAANLDVTPEQLRGVEFDEKKRTLVFRRYYHLFEETELSNLVQRIESAHVEDSFYDKSNWCVVMRRST